MITQESLKLWYVPRCSKCKPQPGLDRSAVGRYECWLGWSLSGLHFWHNLSTDMKFNASWYWRHNPVENRYRDSARGRIGGFPPRSDLSGTS